MAHVYEIEDDGETYWWAAESAQEAEALHLKHIGGLSGETPEDEIQVVRLPDEQRMKVNSDDRWGDPLEKSCADWAKQAIGYKVPLVATTCC